MSIHEELIECIGKLNDEQKERVLKFIKQSKMISTGRRKDFAGALEHLGLHFTAEEIDAARRECWSGVSEPEPEQRKAQ